MLPGPPALVERSEMLRTTCAVLALAGLGWALMHSGGRDPGATEIATLMAAPSLLVSRVWRVVPFAELVAASAIAVSAVLVPLVTPLGMSAGRDLNAYTYAAVFYLAVRGLSGSVDGRRLGVIALLALAVVESLNVWQVWVGEHNTRFQLVGTFYWHNQFGVFAVAVALVATGMVMRSRRPEDLIAWIVAPLFTSFAVMSESRAALLGFALAGATLFAVTVTRQQWWALARLAAVVGLAFAVHAGFLAEARAASGGNAATAQNDHSPGRTTLEATSVFRVNAAREAAKVFAHAPLVSHGYGSLADTGWSDVADGTITSPYAHSAELQALSDGGLLLGLPVIVALLLMTWRAARRVTLAARAPTAPQWVNLGLGLAALAMMLHTSMDFDSQYPALGAVLALVVALISPAQPRAASEASRWSPLRGAAVAVTALATVLSGLLVASYWQTTHRLSSAVASLSNDSAKSVVLARAALDDHWFDDPRPAAFVVEATDLGYVFDDATLQRALRDSRDFAGVDPVFRTEWQRVAAVTKTAG